jgi:hypothetical protein
MVYKIPPERAVLNLLCPSLKIKSTEEYFFERNFAMTVEEDMKI